MEKATKKFGSLCLSEKADEPEKVGALFSEWLVFDYRQDIFGGRTGLQFFTEQNPLALHGEELRAYKDMLGFEVGLFEVKTIERGKGVTLTSIASGNEQFVHDVSASLSLRGGETVWVRIASVGGLYHSVGSLFFVLPIHVRPGMQETIAGWKRNSFNARDAARLIFDNGKRGTATEASGAKQPSLKKAERRLTDALARCGMDTFFSLRTFKRWVTNEEKFDLFFASRALFFLAPEGTTEADGTELAEAATDLANLLPRKKLGGASPREYRMKEENGEAQFQLDTLSRDTYADFNEKALQHMREGAYEDAYHTYERLMQKLLDERTPFFSVFRDYANAAICCFHAHGDLEKLGQPLMDAALRINPLYDFGLDMQKYYGLRSKDISRLPKKDRALAKLLFPLMGRLGESAYRKTPFRKYERFLTECGISLAYKTQTKPTVFATDAQGRAIKIGRNDPCPCGSGKKWKKCCGK